MYKRLGRICALLFVLLSLTAEAGYPWDKDQQQLQEIRVLIDERPYVVSCSKEGLVPTGGCGA